MRRGIGLVFCKTGIFKPFSERLERLGMPLFNKAIHLTEKLKTYPPTKVETVEAVDFGFTEVMTDTKGDRYGKRYTPYWQVKTILLSRFHRRLEAEKSVTVPGRTPDAVQSECPPHFVETILVAGSEKFHVQTGRSLGERNK
jgi:hypothetical protein